MGSANGGRSTRTAIYTRVSKDDGSHETENQILVFREEAERVGEEPVEVYVDRESGRKGKREREAFARLFEDAEKRRFDLLRFWALNRFSREGIRKTISYLQRLDHLGVKFRSHTGPYLDTSNELIAHIVLWVTVYYAELESVRISDRTKAELVRARPGEGDREAGRVRSVARAPRLDARGGQAKKSDVPRTGLSVNTVKKYLARLDAGAAGCAGGNAEIVVSPGGGRPATVAEAKIVPDGRTPGRRA